MTFQASHGMSLTPVWARCRNSWRRPAKQLVEVMSMTGRRSNGVLHSSDFVWLSMAKLCVHCLGSVGKSEVPCVDARLGEHRREQMIRGSGRRT